MYVSFCTKPLEAKVIPPSTERIQPRWILAEKRQWEISWFHLGAFPAEISSLFSPTLHQFLTWEKTNDSSSWAIILWRSHCKFRCYGALWSNAHLRTAHTTAHRAQAPSALQHTHLWMRGLSHFWPSIEPLSRQHIRHHFSCRYPSSLAPLTYEPGRQNTWLSRIIASGCSAAPGGPTSGRCLQAEVSCLLYAAGWPRWHVGSAARCWGKSLLLCCAWHLPW